VRVADQVGVRRPPGTDGVLRVSVNEDVDVIFEALHGTGKYRKFLVVARPRSDLNATPRLTARSSVSDSGPARAAWARVQHVAAHTMMCRRTVPRSAGFVVFGWAIFAGSWIAGSSPTLHSALVSNKPQLPRHTEGPPPPWLKAERKRSSPRHDAKGDVVGVQGSEQAAEAAAELKEHIDVEAAPPASEVLSAMGSMTRSAADDPWMRHGQGAWRLIILFQHNLPILQQAVDGYVLAAPSRISYSTLGTNSSLADCIPFLCELVSGNVCSWPSLPACLHSCLQRQPTSTVPTPTNITPNDGSTMTIAFGQHKRL
jgi:hypothetical protein